MTIFIYIYIYIYIYIHARKSLQLWLTLCHPTNCSLLGPFVLGILQARILEWLATSPPGDLFNPGIEPVSPELAGEFFTIEPHTHI